MIRVQAIDTVKNGYVKLVLDKLSGICADLVRLDEDWQESPFTQLVEALRKWNTRNPKIIPALRQVSNVKMHIKQMIKIISIVTVFIMRNLGIKLVTA